MERLILEACPEGWELHLGQMPVHVGVPEIPQRAMVQGSMFWEWNMPILPVHSPPMFFIVQWREVIFAFVSTHLRRTQVLVSAAKLPGIMSKWRTGEKRWPFWRFKRSHLQSFLSFLVCKIRAVDNMATGSFPFNISVFFFWRPWEQRKDVTPPRTSAQHCRR